MQPNKSRFSSPLKQLNYRLQRLDESNEVTQKLKQKLEDYMINKLKEPKPEEHERETLYSCLNSMLSTAVTTGDKTL